MKKVNEIIENPVFRDELKKIKDIETGRIYCCHGLDHLMDVARVAYILSLEQDFGLNKEVVYAAALLHDIGRAEQYKTGINHREAGYKIAGIILESCSYSSSEQTEILECVRKHGNDVKETDKLLFCISKADHITRMCFDCNAYDSCKWDEFDKNTEIIY